MEKKVGGMGIEPGTFGVFFVITPPFPVTEPIGRQTN